MFNNIGGKIKGLAEIICGLGIGASILCGVGITIANGVYFIPAGIMIIVFGSIFSWVSSFALYAFGQITENSDIMTEYTYASAKNSEITVETLDIITDKLDILIQQQNK